jgi:hypothetical protein
MTNLKLLSLPLLGVLLYSACTNNDPIQARRDLLGPGDYGQIRALSLTPLGSDTSFGKIENTGFSFYLLAGNLDGAQSQSLLLFDKKALAGFQSVAGVFKQTQLLLPIHLVAGEGQDYAPTLHRVTGAWEESAVTAEKFNHQIDPLSIGVASFVSLDSLRKLDNKIDTLWFNIDSAAVKTWIADTSQHLGVVVRAESPEVLMEFFSRHSVSSVPRLKVVLTRSTGTDTTLFANVSADAFIFTRTLSLPSERYYLGNGESFQTYLAFALDSLPAKATINRAELQLALDTTLTSNTSDGFAFVGYRVKGIANGDSLRFILDDTTTTADDRHILATGIIAAADKSLKIDLTAITQRWRLDPEVNLGLLLQSVSATRDLIRIAFFSESGDPALAPKLVIDYTVPPQ